jgi:hypothetical protein
MDSKLLATIIAVAKKEAGTQARDLSALEAKVAKQLQEFHKRSPILETPSFSVKNGCLHCTWSSGLTLDFGNIVGPQGPQGIQGPVGATGASGAHGIDGRDGKTGPQGLRGPKGPVGLQGDKGIPGLPGVDGSDGRIGAEGLDGEDGVGINKVWVDDKYHLTFKLTSGKVVDAGYVRGPTGAGAGKGGRVTGAYIGGGGGSASQLKNPVFTYAAGVLASIAYDNGSKVLTYNGDGTLNTLATTISGTTTTKTMTYNADGTLASISET